MKPSSSTVLVATTSFIPEYKIERYLGVAFGATVRSRGVGGDCMAGCSSTCGGEVAAYTQMSIDARNQAIQRMITDAVRLGANAVIALKFDSDQIGQGGNNSTVAYGTAVYIVPSH